MDRRRDAEQLARALNAVLDGDPLAMPAILACEHGDLLAVAAGAEPPLLLTKAGVVAVLSGLLVGKYTPVQAQQWASFIRYGYVAGQAGGPIRPLDIDYEGAFEDAIVEAVSKLERIGDLVDGHVSNDDALMLLRLLR